MRVGEKVQGRFKNGCSIYPLPTMHMMCRQNPWQALVILTPQLCKWSVIPASRLPLLEKYFYYFIFLFMSCRGCFIWRKKNVRFSRYLHLCVFDKHTNFKIYDSIIDITADYKLHFRLFFFSVFLIVHIYNDDKIVSVIIVIETHEKIKLN